MISGNSFCHRALTEFKGHLLIARLHYRVSCSEFMEKSSLVLEFLFIGHVALASLVFYLLIPKVTNQGLSPTRLETSALQPFATGTCQLRPDPYR